EHTANARINRCGPRLAATNTENAIAIKDNMTWRARSKRDCTSQLCQCCRNTSSGIDATNRGVARVVVVDVASRADGASAANTGRAFATAKVSVRSISIWTAAMGSLLR